MKITHVKTYLVHEKQRKNFIFVKLETDAGVAGWGEAHTSLDMDTAVSAHLEQISRYVIGRDPFHIRNLRKSRATILHGAMGRSNCLARSPALRWRCGTSSARR